MVVQGVCRCRYYSIEMMVDCRATSCQLFLSFIQIFVYRLFTVLPALGIFPTGFTVSWPIAMAILPANVIFSVTLSKNIISTSPFLISDFSASSVAILLVGVFTTKSGENNLYNVAVSFFKKTSLCAFSSSRISVSAWFCAFTKKKMKDYRRED
jgi:hypothetical protein